MARHFRLTACTLALGALAAMGITAVGSSTAPTASAVAVNSVAASDTPTPSTNALTIVRFVDPTKGLYAIEITNISGIGYINNFRWAPPPGLTVTAVTDVTGGTCHLDSGVIACKASGKGIAPPKCTCEPGGSMSVEFKGTPINRKKIAGVWNAYGDVGASTEITKMTPVPYHIPSFQSPSNGV